MEEVRLETASMVTSDGIRLDADVYRPAGEGPWPVLLLRQAYGRKVASSIVYAHPRWYAAQGFIVVVQDVRGRGTSQGTFRTLRNEARDGAETIAWCAALPGSSGAVGMYGFSLQGMNQLLAASLAGPELKAIAPAMIGWDLPNDMLGLDGVTQLAGAIGWAAQVGADSARHAGDEEAYNALRAAANAPQVGTAVPLRSETLLEYPQYHHLFDWLDAGEDGELWHEIAPAARREALAKGDLPMFFTGGWYDFTLPGTLSAFAELNDGKRPVSLVIGPWAHMPWGRTVGPHDFGPEAVSPIDAMQVAWFAHWLKGEPLEMPRVRLFDTGLKRWHDFDALPEANLSFALTSAGNATIDTGAGFLCADDTSAAKAPDETFVHDPWRPIPTRGGRYGGPPGPEDRRDLDTRGDVLTFTSAPRGEALAIAGNLSLTLDIQADTPSFDVHAILSVVTPDGASRPFAEGAARSTGGRSGPMEIDLKAACVSLLPGESLRLSLQGANFPAFVLNDGNDAGPFVPHREARVITLTVRTQGTSTLRIAAGTPDA